MFKRWKRFEGSATVWKDGSSQAIGFTVKVPLTCQHLPTLNQTFGWEFMCELLELRGISGESNET